MVSLMKYLDPMTTAQEKMTKVCVFLEQHNLAPTPINYHVVYAYVSGDNPALNSEMDAVVKGNHPIDDYFIEHCYYDYVSDAHHAEETLFKCVENVTDSLSQAAKQSEQALAQYIHFLDDGLSHLDTLTQSELQHLVRQLHSASKDLQRGQNSFKDALNHAHSEILDTKNTLAELRENQFIDSTTGLYKKRYLNKEAQLWLSRSQQVCAISIQLANFKEFKNRYGEMISDIVIAKAAEKVNSYVFESGISARTAEEEFTIIVPEIDQATAQLIAERMRQGVEKLKFVSSRSGRRLPPIEVREGVAVSCEKRCINTLTDNARAHASRLDTLN